MRTRIGFAVAATLVAIGAVTVVAADPPRIDEPASGSLARATRNPALTTDLVTVYNSGPLTDSVATRAIQAATDAGGTAVVGRSASVGLVRIRRGASTVQQPAAGFAYPMGTTVLPQSFVGPAMGTSVSAAMTSTKVVMSELTASLRGARAGDVVTVVADSGTQVDYTIGAVVADSITGGTEILMSPEAAARIGLYRLSRVVMWGFDSRAAIDAQLAAKGLISTSIRVRRSWDPTDPDFTMGMAQTKQRLGEFSYRVNGDGSVTQDAAWRTANITSGSIGQLRLYTGCHKTVRPALQAAMSELIASGLEYTINYTHANSAGGCYYPRFNRLTPNSRLGFLSRHSWGQAVDTNTVGSCQGCAPPDMDCRTVRIFRKHGFAWGGNFLTPDGMHFEWVGERRDQLPYPSRFCPNPGSSALDAAPGDGPDGQLPIEDTERATFFADDGLDDLHDH
jgi:hypothetical protein